MLFAWTGQGKKIPSPEYAADVVCGPEQGFLKGVEHDSRLR